MEKILPIFNATLQCGHQFHKRCLAIWAGDPKNEIDKNKTCPYCRAPLEIKSGPDTIRRGGTRRKKSKAKKSKARKSNTRKSNTRKSKAKKLNTRKSKAKKN
jgi:hypothetical protein